ncbi:hypothetical protein L0B53_05560 [Vibrio sp. SS-MA-C1-2]|uniref:tetratricopeptide repeat protein n=1 Tax=Vibrio sp. SS-MA-C1-2 TaxID=2908646 RepID=UPI001F42C4E5|nr:hypothetical protein [Vibrio sp. SS-MA-C1-2]UJF19056.1 hypothetical protein L0B53_05560 [Vibrio sp. SS-MA-C1-2]
MNWDLIFLLFIIFSVITFAVYVLFIKQKPLNIAGYPLSKLQFLILILFILLIPCYSLSIIFNQTIDVSSPPQVQQITVIDSENQNIKEIQQQLQKDQNNGETWSKLGRAYYDNQQFNSALMSLKQSQELTGERVESLTLMADIYYYQQQNSEQLAKTLIDRALTLNPNYSAALQLKAKILMLEGNDKEAIELWSQLIDQPEFPHPVQEQ